MSNFVTRELSEMERDTVRWLLRHGTEAAADYLPHAERLTVVGGCPCGCASVDFALDGMAAEPSGLKIISDHWWADDQAHVGGIFLFAMSGQIAGIEVYSMDGICDVSTLPDLDRLVPISYN